MQAGGGLLYARLKMHSAPAFLHLLHGKLEIKWPFEWTASSAAPPGVNISSGPSVKHRTFWLWQRSQDCRRGMGVLGADISTIWGE